MADGSVGMLKVCTKCRIAQGATAFYVVNGKARPECKRCQLKRQQAWVKKNNKSAEYSRLYRQRHPEKARAADRRYQRLNREKCIQRTRDWQDRNPHQQLFRCALGRARKSGKKMTITKDWVADKLRAGVCELTGLQFTWRAPVRGRCGPFSPSIDRIDNSKGYTPENCRVIVWALNMGFSEWGQIVYAEIARAYLDKNRGC